jgi:hypothetical protein
MGQTVNLLAPPSGVRIPPCPPFSFFGTSRSVDNTANYKAALNNPHIFQDSNKDILLPAENPAIQSQDLALALAPITEMGTLRRLVASFETAGVFANHFQKTYKAPANQSKASALQ